MTNDYAYTPRRAPESMPDGGAFLYPEIDGTFTVTAKEESSELGDDQYYHLLTDNGEIILGDSGVYIPPFPFIPQDTIVQLADDSGLYILLGDDTANVLQGDYQEAIQDFTPEANATSPSFNIGGSYSPTFVVEGYP